MSRDTVVLRSRPPLLGAVRLHHESQSEKTAAGVAQRHQYGLILVRKPACQCHRISRWSRCRETPVALPESLAYWGFGVVQGRNRDQRALAMLMQQGDMVVDYHQPLRHALPLEQPRLRARRDWSGAVLSEDAPRRRCMRSATESSVWGGGGAVVPCEAPLWRRKSARRWLRSIATLPRQE